MELTVRLPVIGVVRTSHHALETTPIQAGLNRAEHLLDGTPVIDIKPYVTRFDRPPGDPRCGWFDQLTIADGSTPGKLAQP
jgi:hypothetical protein